MSEVAREVLLSAKPNATKTHYWRNTSHSASTYGTATCAVTGCAYVHTSTWNVQSV
jgi:hypothetical protein